MTNKENGILTEEALFEEHKSDVSFAFKQIVNLVLDPNLGTTISTQKDSEGNLVFKRVMDLDYSPFSTANVTATQEGDKIVVTEVDLFDTPLSWRKNIYVTEDEISQWERFDGDRIKSVHVRGWEARLPKGSVSQ